MSSQPINEDALKRFQRLWNGQLLPIVSAVQLLLFGLLAWVVHKHAAFPVDVLISRRVQKNHGPLLHHGSAAISNISKASLLNLLVIPFAAVLWKLHLRLEAMMTVGTCFSAALVRLAIRRIVNRPRPNPLLVRVKQKPHGQSFPSGHVISSITFWGWICIVGSRLLKGKPLWQKAILSVPVLVVMLVGPTRIYLGDHWTSDVLGGYLFAGGWLGLSLQLYLELSRKPVVR
jgi:membrane-associated phospholipid phosphatase